MSQPQSTRSTHPPIHPSHRLPLKGFVPVLEAIDDCHLVVHCVPNHGDVMMMMVIMTMVMMMMTIMVMVMVKMVMMNTMVI